MVEVEREPEVVWTFIEYVCVCAGSIARCWGDMPHGDLVFDCVEDIRRRPVEDEKKNYNWKLDDVFYQFVGRGATEVGCPAGKLMISVLARVGGGLWARIRRLSVKVRIRPGMLMPPATCQSVTLSGLITHWLYVLLTFVSIPRVSMYLRVDFVAQLTLYFR